MTIRVALLAGLCLAAAGQTVNPPSGGSGGSGGGSGTVSGLTAGCIPVAVTGSSLTADAPVCLDPITGQGVFSKSIATPVIPVAFATSIAIDLALGNDFQVGTLTNNIVAVAFTHPKAGIHGVIKFTQGAGNHTVTLPEGFCEITLTAGVSTWVPFHVEADGSTVVGETCSDTAPAPFRVFGALFYQGGSALESGTTVGASVHYFPPLGFSCQTKKWSLTIAPSGTAGFRVWRIPSGTEIPTVSDTLNDADLAISTGTNVLSTTMTGFVGDAGPAFAIGDLLAFQLNASSTATYAIAALHCQ